MTRFPVQNSQTKVVLMSNDVHSNKVKLDHPIPINAIPKVQLPMSFNNEVNFP